MGQSSVPLAWLIVIYLTGSGGAACGESGKRIIDLEPWYAAPCPDVVLGLNAVRMIQAPHGYLHLLLQNLLMHGEDTSALRTESTLGVF